MNYRAVLIEDNEQNRYLATFLLEGRGYTVAHASDGATGVEIARTVVPDVILLDIQLPQMDGYAVARELRRVATLDGVPIVAVTSFAMAGDREAAMAAGCDGYIEKPIDPDTFVDQVTAHLRNRAPHGTP